MSPLRPLGGPVTYVLPQASPLTPDPVVHCCRLGHGYKTVWSTCLAKCYDFTRYLYMAVVFENSQFLKISVIKTELKKKKKE